MLVGASGGEDFHLKPDEAPGQVHDARLVVDADESSLDFSHNDFLTKVAVGFLPDVEPDICHVRHRVREGD